MTTTKQTPISSEELMIGNILQYQECTTLMQGRVTSIPNGKKICIDHIPVKIENVIGVKLSPEILEKCGAIRIDHRGFSISIDNGWNIIWETNGYIYIKYLNTECEVSHVEFKYLHQLQNLYFSLTGSHLKVEL